MFAAILKCSEWSRGRFAKYGIRFTLGDQLEVGVNASLARIKGCKEINFKERHLTVFGEKVSYHERE